MLKSQLDQIQTNGPDRIQVLEEGGAEDMTESQLLDLQSEFQPLYNSMCCGSPVVLDVLW